MLINVNIQRNIASRRSSDGECEEEVSMSGRLEIDRYLESCQTEFWQKVFRAELDYLTRRLEGSEDVLSVGCGPAIIERALSERGFRVTGLDVSQEALNCAPDRIRTVAARAEDMPFPESSFDAVIYIASLQFIEDYRKAIEKTERVLRPDGKLIVMLLNPASVFFRVRIRNIRSYVRKIRHKDINEIERVIAEKFQVQTEYFLGVKGENIFESGDAAEAALYIITGFTSKSRARIPGSGSRSAK
jgi:ubiquinone/menaquinone biosynthesis C-methylase UbiE